jgi:hypothetical protein
MAFERGGLMSKGRRSVIVGARFDGDEHAKLVAAAKRERRSVSAFVRNTVSEYLRYLESQARRNRRQPQSSNADAEMIGASGPPQ